MTEATPPPTPPPTGEPSAPPAPPAPPAGDPPAPEPEKDWKAEYEKTLTESRKWEDRAKANKTKADAHDKLQRESMSELERAVDEAKAATRAEVLRDVGGGRVRDKVRAAAAGRAETEVLDGLIEGLDPTRFLGDDGEPDPTAIQSWVDRVLPADTAATAALFPDLGQGARGTPAAGGPADDFAKVLNTALKH